MNYDKLIKKYDIKEKIGYSLEEDYCKKDSIDVVTSLMAREVSDLTQTYKELEYLKYCLYNQAVNEYKNSKKVEIGFNKIELEINNGRTMRIKQSNEDKIRDGVALEIIDYNGEIDRRDLIDAGDFVMLMNYYRYIKDNDIKDDFINRNGLNDKEDFYLQADDIEL